MSDNGKLTAAKTLGVLLNWRRPFNIARVLESMRAQSEPMYLALVECSPGTEYAVGPQAAALADCTISISENIGPISRLLAPLALPQFEYTYFAVDDHIPGPKHVEWLLRTARMLGNQFATIGQDGRRVEGGVIVHKKGRMEVGKPVSTDIITTSELMRTELAPEIMDWRLRFTRDPGANCSFLEDDLFICFAAQHATNCPSYLTPEPPTSAESWRSVRLPAPHALCARENHHEVRDYFVKCAEEFGWFSRAN